MDSEALLQSTMNIFWIIPLDFWVWDSWYHRPPAEKFSASKRIFDELFEICIKAVVHTYISSTSSFLRTEYKQCTSTIPYFAEYLEPLQDPMEVPVSQFGDNRARKLQQNFKACLIWSLNKATILEFI